MTKLSRRRFAGMLVALGTGSFVSAEPNGLSQGNDKADVPGVLSDDLQNWEKHPSLRAMADAFRFLSRSDLAKLETGRHDIRGNDLYALVQRPESRSVETAEFEAHRLYLDIQYLISGEEYIAVTSLAGLSVSKPYDEAKDIEFFAKPARFEKVKMRPGRFVVLYPRDAHAPNCYSSRPGPLHKVVVKVRLQG